MINIKTFYLGQNIFRYNLHPSSILLNYLPSLIIKHNVSARPRNVKIFERTKIVWSLIGDKMKAALDTKHNYFDVNVMIMYIKK